MWKESYRIGIKQIDDQHKELFTYTKRLLDAVNSNADGKVYEEIISFLKNYVVFHFNDEEEYQRSIGYSDYDVHVIAHRKFTDLVLEYEKRLIETNYDLAIVKELAGTLTSWLIHHVAYTDIKIAGDRQTKEDDENISAVEKFTSIVFETLNAVSGMDCSGTTSGESFGSDFEEDVSINVNLVGDVEGSLIFGYSEELAFNLIHNMTFIRPEQIDELVCSALSEISNISSGKLTIYLSNKGLNCDITTPKVSINEAADHDNVLGGTVIDTQMGKLKLSADLTKF